MRGCRIVERRNVSDSMAVVLARRCLARLQRDMRQLVNVDKVLFVEVSEGDLR